MVDTIAVLRELLALLPPFARDPNIAGNGAHYTNGLFVQLKDIRRLAELLPKANAALAALEASPGVVVPREPTRAMLDAAHEDLVRDGPIDQMCKGIYAAMLAAAPKPSDAEDDEARRFAYGEWMAAQGFTPTPQADPAPSVAVRRFDVDVEEAIEVEHAEGAYILHADHARIVAEKDARIETLRATADRATERADDAEARADALAGVLAEAVELQRLHYGSACGLHIDMIGWATKARALLSEAGK